MSDDRLTVITLNWKRPANVVRFARAYASMPAVAKVIIADCNPSGGLKLDCPLCTVIRFDEDPGLVARFAMAGFARTPAVLLADDDIELPEVTVNKLHQSWLSNGIKSSVVGLFGRKPDADGNYDSLRSVHGAVPIVLTRAVVTSPHLCLQAADWTMKMALELGGEPFGNGEDIVLSYAALAATDGKPNMTLKADFKNKDYDDVNAISVRYSAHAEHRTRVVRWCREHLFDDRKMKC